MIDWVHVTVPFSHPIHIGGGRILKLMPSDNPSDPPIVEWETNCRLTMEGSWSSKVAIRSHGAGFLEISGNLVKYFQGHNLWGTDDLRLLVYRFMGIVCQQFGVEPVQSDQDQWLYGVYPITRVDINYMLSFRDRAEVRTVLRALESVGVPYRGKASNVGGTLYWGKSDFGKKAKAWLIKMYCKADELEMKEIPRNAEDQAAMKDDQRAFAGKLPKHIQGREEMCQWVDNKLRVELTLRRPELLKMGIENATALTPEFVKEIFFAYVGRLNIGDTVAYTVDDIERLPRALRATFNLWKMGFDLRQQLSKPTYFRHKKIIFDRLGIDISVIQPKDARIIPLRQVISMNFEPAPIPEFAVKRNLVLLPSRYEIEMMEELKARAA
jgi:II/X family phage/plasmid replication protein